MLNDLFKRVGVREGNKTVSAYLIACHHCSNHDHLHIRNSSNTLPIDIVAKKFRDRGWDIGHNRRHDICPDCCIRLSAKTRLPGGFKPPQENQTLAKQAACNGLLRELAMIRTCLADGRELDSLPRRMTAVEETAARLQNA
jgi:hypothetical protein